MGNSNQTNDTMRVELLKCHELIIVSITGNVTTRVEENMDLTERLQQLLELDELKSDTTTTKAIQEVLKNFLSLDGSKKLKLRQLVEKIRRSYELMLVTVKKRRSVTSKLDKLYCLFHDFTISEGFEMCLSCEKDLEMIVPEILWQLLMEKEFIWFLTTELVSDTKDQPTTDQSASRALSEIEKNAVRYTGGYVIRKLEQNFSKKKINLKLQQKKGVKRTRSLRKELDLQ